jgi:hypothetical protein
VEISDDLCDDDDGPLSSRNKIDLVENEPPARVASACTLEPQALDRWFEACSHTAVSFTGFFFPYLPCGLCVQIIQCTRLVLLFKFSLCADV